MNKSEYNHLRVSHWDRVAAQWAKRKGLGGYYHRRLFKVFRFLIAPGSRVLELGCGQGDLLAALEPSRGVGVDFSPESVRLAAQKYPKLRFLCADAADIALNETFDFIVLSDLIDDLWDVQKAFDAIKAHSGPKTRVIINFYSRLWEKPLWIAQKLGWVKPNMAQNWLTRTDVVNLLNLADFEVVRSWVEFLSPIYIPVLSSLANRFLVKLWLIKHFALTHFIVARLKPIQQAVPAKPSVSVVIPARNEARNIRDIFDRTPEMGSGSELIFVEGHSTDDTYSAIEREIERHRERRCLLLKQSGVGKCDAVRLGFERASGDILMILDADLTVPPEDLRTFYEALSSGKGELINGVRLVYPREKQAMLFLNAIGNKFFGLAFSWLLGQPLKDTLCGTKVLSREDYSRIAANRSYFGDFDPFGDFDLIFGAAKLNLKIVDLPIRYKERVYGRTNIQRWKHGWLLLRMLAVAARRLKFI